MSNDTNVHNDKHSSQLQNKEEFEKVMKRKFFYVPSSEIYGGVAGLFDLGPVGAALENQIVEAWRRHFIYEDSMMEVRCCQLTPYPILKASGHVDRFSDVMVKDSTTGDSYRCDHLIKNHFEKMIKDKRTNEADKREFEEILREIDNLKKHHMQEIIDKYGITAPETNNKLSQPTDFNLMFSTSIGPSGTLTGFMRPETAQGIFVNFKRLLEFNNNRIPFAAAQIGFGFRNEISPRSGLIRCREFLMAEIEHFVHPDRKNHPKFNKVSDLVVNLFSAYNQTHGLHETPTSLHEAVDKKIVANNMIAYYIGRVYLFLKNIGLDTSRIRFRQHMSNEMAHYACDCWDCEIHSYHGWVECVGIADRACFDLAQHSTASGVSLTAQEQLETPKMVKIVEFVLEKGVIGKTFKTDAKKIVEHLQTMKSDDAIKLYEYLNIHQSCEIVLESKSYEIHRNMIKTINVSEKEDHVHHYYPHVIEPSFGIGRIMYSLLSHACMFRKSDSQRIWFDLPPTVAPVKCTLLPLSNKTDFDPIINELSNQFSSHGVTYRVDDMGVSIGKRYSRADEIGTPYGITVDFDSIRILPSTVTIRHRNTTDQIRVKTNEAVKLISKLIKNKVTWQSMVDQHGLFTGQKTI